MTEPDAYRVPSDDELLTIYAKGTGSDNTFGSSYDGWTALWMAGYRDGASVRPNVESDASTVGEAWTEYYRPGMSSEEAQAFKAGHAYGKRADVRIRPEWWVWPTVVSTGLLCGLISSMVTSWFVGA